MQPGERLSREALLEEGVQLTEWANGILELAESLPASKALLAREIAASMLRSAEEKKRIAERGEFADVQQYLAGNDPGVVVFK